MSAKSTGIIWDMEIPVPERMVLLSMADHADHNGEHIHAPASFIAWKTGYKVRNVWNITRDLIAAGLLVVTGSALGIPNEYKFDFSAAKMKPPYGGVKPKTYRPTPAKIAQGTYAKIAQGSTDTPAKIAQGSTDTPAKIAQGTPTPAKIAQGTYAKIAIDSKSTIVGVGVGVGESLTRELIERGLNPTSAEAIAQSGCDNATILQSLDNMLADGRVARRDRDKVLGNFMRRWKAAPPPDGTPYARQNESVASSAPPPPPAPRAVLTQQELRALNEQYDPFKKEHANGA